MKISEVSEMILKKTGNTNIKIFNDHAPAYDAAVKAIDELTTKTGNVWGVILVDYFDKCNGVSFILGGCAVGACVRLYFGGKKLINRYKEIKKRGKEETQN